MMDKDQAIKLMNSVMPIPYGKYREIANLIEQQAKQIESMRNLIIKFANSSERILEECKWINNATYENIDIDELEDVLSKYKEWDGGSE